eukprot:Blabericola_migrator_1__2594@NODE_1732_length_3906_cov_297_505600_g1119_i0_p2_GENE_NODE_1732_length_3906_cov_297_505600_g1119_i0NODE_1732_length_3906_cov_297_505600_g1119_i0_p2_ORF_typecomplete_len288_score60_40DSPc/PF00782_20/4_3e13CDKN3/PF05706_12/0_011_NODE_1732_length_3906_cov_297_505600_g1119_i09872
MNTLHEMKSPIKVELTEEVMRQWLQLLHKLARGRRAAQAPVDVNTLSQVAEHLYIGSISAVTEANMKALRIKKVIKCCVSDIEPSPSGVEVVTIPEPQASTTFLSSNIFFVRDHVEACRREGQKCAIVCVSGANRAVILCAAYLVYWRKSSLLSVLSLLTERLGSVCGIEDFQKQLITFANTQGRLDPPNTWPEFDAENRARDNTDSLMTGWKYASLDLFDDDADYDDDPNKRGPDGLILSPQQLAYRYHRQAMKKYESMKAAGKNRYYIGSDCASDGGDGVSVDLL